MQVQIHDTITIIPVPPLGIMQLTQEIKQLASITINECQGPVVQSNVSLTSSLRGFKTCKFFTTQHIFVH